MPTDKMLEIIADIERICEVKCYDYTFAGCCNFIEKYGSELGYDYGEILK